MSATYRPSPARKSWWRRVLVRDDVRMSYFTAVLATDGSAWRALDVDVDEASDIDDLAEEARADASGPVLVVLEREDEWFALVRADGREPRTFVSDLTATASSRYADLLASAADSPAVVPEEDDEDDEEERAAVVAAPTWAGDAALLTDLGIDGEALAELAEGKDPASALVELGERCGFVELLEALR